MDLIYLGHKRPSGKLESPLIDPGHFRDAPAVRRMQTVFTTSEWRAAHVLDLLSTGIDQCFCPVGYD